MANRKIKFKSAEKPIQYLKFCQSSTVFNTFKETFFLKCGVVLVKNNFFFQEKKLNGSTFYFLYILWALVGVYIYVHKSCSFKSKIALLLATF